MRIHWQEDPVAALSMHQPAGCEGSRKGSCAFLVKIILSRVHAFPPCGGTKSAVSSSSGLCRTTTPTMEQHRLSLSAQKAGPRGWFGPEGAAPAGATSTAGHPSDVRPLQPNLKLPDVSTIFTAPAAGQTVASHVGEHLPLADAILAGRRAVGSPQVGLTEVVDAVVQILLDLHVL